MKDEHKIAILCARVVDLLRRNPEAVDDQKAALSSLLEVTNRRSFTVRVRGQKLAVEGSVIPPDVPFVADFVSQMRSHGVGEVIVAQGTAALDMMHLFRALAPAAPAGADGSAVRQSLSDAEVRRIAVVELASEAAADDRRERRVTDALEASAEAEGTEDGEQEHLDIIPEHEGAGFSELMERSKGAVVSPNAAVRGLTQFGGVAETTRVP